MNIIHAAYLVAVVADGVVCLVAAGVHLGLDMLRKFSSLNGGLKTVLRMVAMSILGEARLAEIEVIALLAMDKLRGVVFCSEKET